MRDFRNITTEELQWLVLNLDEKIKELEELASGVIKDATNLRHLLSCERKKTKTLQEELAKEKRINSDLEAKIEEIVVSTTKNVAKERIINKMLGEIIGEMKVTRNTVPSDGEFWSINVTKVLPKGDWTLTAPVYVKTPILSTELEIKTKNPYIPTRVIFNPPHTTCFFPDGDIVVVKCSEKDEFKEDYGVMAAIVRKIFPTRASFERLVESGTRIKQKKQKKSEENVKFI